MTDAEQQLLIAEVIKKMANTKSYNGILNLNLNIDQILKSPADEIKPIIYFTMKAYLKMTRLVQSAPQEIGWHGIVKKLNTHEYLIEDIVVFPQVVTGASVTPDAIEYMNWLYSFDDDTFPHIRFHGHSHVDMGVSPSGTDTKYRGDILDQMGPNDFYIFMILNKRNDIDLALFDLANNRMYEKKDCTIEILLSEDKTDTIGAFIREANTQVTHYLAPKAPLTSPADKKKETEKIIVIHPPGASESEEDILLGDDDTISSAYYKEWCKNHPNEAAKYYGIGGRLL